MEESEANKEMEERNQQEGGDADGKVHGRARMLCSWSIKTTTHLDLN